LLAKDLETTSTAIAIQWANEEPFLNNGSVKTFPRKRDAHNNRVYSYNGNGGVFYLVRAEELKRR
jgi:hypothetical protein